MNNQPWLRASLASLVILIAAAALGAIPAAAAEAPPGLSIEIDNDTDETAPDSDVEYVVTLSNRGTDPVASTVVVTVPGYVSVTAADGGAIDGTTVTWSASVEPARPSTFTVSAHVGDIPAGEYRVTTLASVFLGDDTSTRPLIRTADADRIPGVEEPVVPAPPSTDRSSETTLLIVAISAGIVVVVGTIVAVVVAVRRRSTRHPGSLPVLDDESAHPEGADLDVRLRRDRRDQSLSPGA